jgi:hypothetical protein
MDRVRILKIETPSEGGTQTNTRPQLLNYSEDYVSAKGISFENLENSFIDISSGISGTDISFNDTINGEVLLSELKSSIPKITASTSPAVTDDIDTYKEGKIWLRQDTNQAWLCTDNTNNAAIWQPIGIQTFTYATEAEAAKGVDYNLCYVTENDTWYRHESVGSSYTDDNKWVLSTANGGNTRWIGVAGKYIVTNTNVFYGMSALAINSSGSGNTAVGDQALYSSISANYNTAVGRGAGFQVTGSSNTFIGNGAGYNASSGSNNIALGYAAYNGAISPTFATGSNNIAIGYQAGMSASTMAKSILVGYRAGYTITSSADVISIGYQAGYLNSTANNVIAIGTNSLYNNTVGNNIAIGYSAGESNTSAVWISYIGYQSGQYATGASNLALGYQAFKGVSGQTTGINNIAIGVQAMYVATTAQANIAIGYKSLLDITTGYDNIAIGETTLENIIGGYQNIAIGRHALSEPNSNTANCIAIGQYAGQYSYGNCNLYIGYESGKGVTGGTTTGTYNAGIGYGSLKALTTASYSVAIGYSALASLNSGGRNVGIGYQAGNSITSGTNNIILGYDADLASDTNSNSIVIGSGAVSTANNQTFVGNASTTTTIIKGIYGNTNGANPFVRVGSDGTLYEDNNPPSGSVSFYEDIFTATASQTQFTLTNSPVSEAATWVFIDAAYSATDQYTISTNVLTLGSGLSGGEKVVIKYVY